MSSTELWDTFQEIKSTFSENLTDDEMDDDEMDDDNDNDDCDESEDESWDWCDSDSKSDGKFKLGPSWNLGYEEKNKTATTNSSDSATASDPATVSESTLSENATEKCNNCPEGIVLPDEGRFVCHSCGVDHGPIIDYSQEWRFYGSGDNKRRNDPTRCGMPVNDLLPESTTSTILLGRGNELYRRLHKWNQMTYKEKSLITDFNEFKDVCLKHNIPISVIDKTKILYKALRYDEKLYDMKRGTTKKGLMAACIYYSCKDKKISKSPKEISEIFDIKVNKVTNGIKDFKKLMYCKDQEYSKNMKASTPEEYIRFFGNKIGMSDKHIEITIYVSNAADLLGIVPENIPHSMAIGCIYFTIIHFNLEFNKKYVATKCQISEVTISKTCKKLEPFKKYLIPTEENLKVLAESK